MNHLQAVNKDEQQKIKDFFEKRYSLSKLAKDANLISQYQILKNLDRQLVGRLGKFVIVDTRKKKIVKSCDDVTKALLDIYKLDIKTQSFICQMPLAV